MNVSGGNLYHFWSDDLRAIECFTMFSFVSDQVAHNIQDGGYSVVLSDCNIWSSTAVV